MMRGRVDWALMGNPKALLPAPQIYYRPMFDAFGMANQLGRENFMSQAALDMGIWEQIELKSPTVSVKRSRDVTRDNLLYNDPAPEIEVDPETFKVTVNSKDVHIDPATSLPLTQIYFLA